ncbi:MAG TPA: ATP-binding protein, partial [Candidatus Omnitrophota bacterium]|nr:ATP-binding protein [Candidatus Omnitrophota bacterium]
ARPEEDLVWIRVTDTGIGLKEDERRKLFNEFYRVDNEINQNVKGSGLGLSLARKIIEAHNGQIWVESVYKKGSTFAFTIPLDDQK